MTTNEFRKIMLELEEFKGYSMVIETKCKGEWLVTMWGKDESR